MQYIPLVVLSVCVWGLGGWISCNIGKCFTIIWKNDFKNVLKNLILKLKKDQIQMTMLNEMFKENATEKLEVIGSHSDRIGCSHKMLATRCQYRTRQN